jgi:segregation and condensation protein A
MKETVFAVNGHDLFSLGIQQGEEVGKIINYVKQKKIDTLLPIEKYYLKRNLGEILNGIEHKIENFEGPFDLLLHLIKKNEMDIYDIKIYDITTQYLKYLDEMKEIDLEITSEFIVTAATLLEINSKMLLPKSNENEESQEEEDPRKELVSKLLEYKKFKLVANFLAEREKKIGIVFQKKPEIIEEKKGNIDNKDILKDITILHLFNIYNELITNYRNKMNTDNVIEKEFL